MELKLDSRISPFGSTNTENYDSEAQITHRVLFVSLKFGLCWCLCWFFVREKYNSFAENTAKVVLKNRMIENRCLSYSHINCHTRCRWRATQHYPQKGPRSCIPLFSRNWHIQICKPAVHAFCSPRHVLHPLCNTRCRRGLRGHHVLTSLFPICSPSHLCSFCSHRVRVWWWRGGSP
jgi:hypothetical protein